MKKGVKIISFSFAILLFLVLNLSFVLALCGDNVLDGTEECDLGDLTSGDGCNSSCQMENGWYCFIDPVQCRTHCGDGILSGGEQCDDENKINGDGCSSLCTIETGYICGSSNSMKSACNDGVDNDGDGFIDLNDVGCTDIYDAVEKEDSIYVSLGGSDSNAGTKNSPLRTLKKAQEITRQKISHGLIRDLVIVIRGGEYILDDVFELNEQDSGNNEHFVIWRSYPGEEVKITTAEILDNSRWESYNGNIYRMQIPDGRDFYTMLEEERRSYIAQEPDLDPNSLTGEFLLTDGQKSVDLGENYFDRIRFREGDLDPTLNYTNIKIELWHADYFTNLLYIKNISFDENIIFFEGKGAYLIPPRDLNPIHIHLNNRYRVQNDLSFLDNPGEYFVDRNSNYLYYYPWDTNFKDKKIYAPKKGFVFKIAGNSNSQVSNLQIHGISFFGTDYVDSNAGDTSKAWAVADNGLIHINWSRNVIISNSSLKYSGTYAINGRENKNLQIEGNIIENIGHHGIRMGGERIGIYDNNMYRIGTIKMTSGGINVGSGIDYADNMIKSNNIKDTSYWGFSIGGNDTVILDNDISQHNRRASDSGGIYLYSSKDGLWKRRLVIKHSYIHDYRQTWPDRTRIEGIYQDGYGVNGVLIYKNLLESPDPGSRASQLRLKGKYNHVLNNIFTGNSIEKRISATEIDDNLYNSEKNRVAKNIFSDTSSSSEVRLYSVSAPFTNQDHFLSEYNIISTDSSKVAIFEFSTKKFYPEWIAAGNDKNSVLTTNPIFIDAVNKNYNIRPDAADLINQIGFEEFDMNFGVRPVNERHGDSICVVKCGYGDLTDTTKCNQINTTNSTPPGGAGEGGLIDDSWPDIGINTNTDNIPITEGTINNFIFIQTYSPSENNITMLTGENRTFSITLQREDYERIEWYLNNRLVEHNFLSYYFDSEELYAGNHTLELVIIKGNFQESKIWNIELIDNYAELEYAFEFKNIILYVIIFTIISMIILLVFLIVNKRNRYY